jgi:acyl-CoA synthetase (AMP-forming)/AMP-acid ligase II
MVDGMIERYELGVDDVVVVAAPLGHAIGFAYGLQLALRARCPLAIVPRWDADVAAHIVESLRGTFVAAPTPFLLDVVEAVEAGSKAFASLRHFLCGGAPVPPTLVERAERALGAGVASAYYGTSEAGAVTTCPPGTPSTKTLTTVGKALPGIELQVVDGEIHVRGAQVCRSYWRGDDEGRLRPEGWYATGDLGEVDDDGYLSITGREKDLIIRGGVNISPVEVENILAGASNVREVAVVGVSDPRLGQRIVAAVVPCDRPPTLDELRDHCHALALSKVKWPERVVILDRLPRTATGKLVRRRLAEDVERTT